MKRRRAMGIGFVAFTVGVGTAWGQFTVSDPGTTARNAVTARLKSQLYNALTQELQRLQQMAERLTARTTLDDYVQPAPVPAGEASREGLLYAREYWQALRHGDPTGLAYSGLARDRHDGDFFDAETSVDVQDAVTPGFASLDLADSTIIDGTNIAGLLRQTAADESQTIDRFERDVVNPSSQQSTAAILDKISGGTLVGAYQRQDRLQYLTAVAEQVLLDNKRTRDTEVGLMNMQFLRMRAHQEHADHLLGGSDSDLRTWRQP